MLFVVVVVIVLRIKIKQKQLVMLKSAFLFSYLKVGQEGVSPGPSGHLCQRRVTVHPGIPGNGSCSTGSQSRCTPEPRSDTQCDPEESENSLQNSYK